MTEYIDVQALYDCLDLITWYNGLSEHVLNWINITEPYIPLKNYGIEDPSDIVNISQLQIIWMFAVCAFGDYGTSPRYGWIENVESFHKWILEITRLWRSSEDYDGPEEYRMKEGTG